MVDGELRALDTLFIDQTDGSLKMQLAEGTLDFDFERPDKNLRSFLDFYLYPDYKNYAFAYSIKKIMTDLFGLSADKVHGTDDDKNERTRIHWSKVSLEAAKGYGFAKRGDIPDRYMTYREFMQVFGTEYIRVFNDNAFINQTLKAIRQDAPQYAVITDGRFESELRAVKRAGGKVIYFTRRVGVDTHASESEVHPDKCKYIDVVIDNHTMTTAEKNWELFKVLHKWGYLPSDFNEQPLEIFKK